MRVAVVLALFLGFLPAKASASCLLCTCSIATVTGVAFGTYLPGAPTLSSGQATVNCLISSGTGTVAYTLQASQGSGSFSQRTLRSGSAALNYNLYTNASYNSVWGDGTSGTATISDSYVLSLLTSKTYPIYGQIPASQNVPAGTYGDTITVTISY